MPNHRNLYKYLLSKFFIEDLYILISEQINMYWFYVQRLKWSRMADDLHFFPFKGDLFEPARSKVLPEIRDTSKGAIMPSTPDIFFQKQKTFLWTTQYFILLHTPNSNIDIHMNKNNKHKYCKILNASVFILCKS